MYPNPFSQEKAKGSGSNLAVACITLKTLINTCSRSAWFQCKFRGNSESTRWGIHGGLPTTRKTQQAQAALLQHRSTAGPSLALATALCFVLLWRHIRGQAGPDSGFPIFCRSLQEVEIKQWRQHKLSSPAQHCFPPRTWAGSWGVFPSNPGVWCFLSWRQAPFCSTQGDFPACKSA